MHRQQLHTHTHARRRKGGAHGRSQGFLGTVLVNAGLSSPWQKEAVMSVPSGMRGRPNRAASAHTNACPPRKGGGYSRPLHTNPNSPPSSYISECPSMFERPVRTIPRPHGLSPCPDSRTLPREEGRCHPEPELLRFKYKYYWENIILYGGSSSRTLNTKTKQLLSWGSVPVARPVLPGSHASCRSPSTLISGVQAPGSGPTTYPPAAQDGGSATQSRIAYFLIKISLRKHLVGWGMSGTDSECNIPKNA